MEILRLLTSSLGITIIIFIQFVTGTFTSWLAIVKGYGKGAGWFFGGFFFGIIALLAIGLAPDRNKNEKLASILSLISEIDTNVENLPDENSFEALKDSLPPRKPNISEEPRKLKIHYEPTLTVTKQEGETVEICSNCGKNVDRKEDKCDRCGAILY